MAARRRSPVRGMARGQARPPERVCERAAPLGRPCRRHGPAVAGPGSPGPHPQELRVQLPGLVASAPVRARSHARVRGGAARPGRGGGARARVGGRTRVASPAGHDRHGPKGRRPDRARLGAAATLGPIRSDPALGRNLCAGRRASGRDRARRVPGWNAISAERPNAQAASRRRRRERHRFPVAGRGA